MLDIRTLFVAHVAVIITAGMVMMLSRHWQPGMRSLGTWGGGAVCLGAGMALTALRGIAPDWLSVLVANGIAAMCPLMIWNGIRRFNGQPARWTETLMLDGAFVMSLAYFLYVHDSLSARIIIAALLLAFGTGAGAYELLRRTDPALRRMSWIASGALGLIAIAQIARVVTIVLGAPQVDIFAPNAVNAASYLGGIVLSSLIIFCLAMMANQQLQLQVEDRSAELEQIARDRDLARARAEQANRAKSVFLTTMSHELRTPLNAILGFSELGPSIPSPAPLPDRVKEYFELIHQSGTHLLKMINDILDLSKVEAGKMEIDCTNLDIDYAVNSTVRLIAPQASSRSQHLMAAIDTPAPALYADERAVKQILFNLLSNAVRFTPDGGTIRVHASAAADGGTEILVSDTGVGIPRDQIARLTMPFEQADNSYSKAHGGTGLGLPLVDALVKLHGGTLTIDSEVGRGTCVRVHFPPAPAGRRKPPASVPADSERRSAASG